MTRRLAWSLAAACSMGLGTVTAEEAPSNVASVPVDSPADAQAGAAPARDDASHSRLLGEIIVTAQKREENLQDVPISVQAFSADALDARGISDQGALQQVTPGLDVGTQVGYATFYLRGVGTEAFLTADPSVAAYVDGVYFPFSQSQTQDFGAVDRIEVLKGPQGTLFGRNAVGGAINIITRSPSFDAPEVSIQSSFANYEDFKTRVFANLPLSDTLAMSLSGLYNHADYYMKGSIDGHGIGPQMNKGARVKLRWAPASWIDVQVAHFGLQDTSTGSLFQLNSHPSGIGSLVGLQAQPGRHGDVDAPAYHYIQSHVTYGTITTYFDWFNMKLLSSRQRFESAGQYDFDGTATPLVSFHAQSQPSNNDSAEFQILSNDTSWGADSLQWIGGAYWFRGYQGFEPATLNVAEIDLAHGQIADIPVPQDVIDGLAAVLDPLGLGVPAGGFAFNAMVGTESFAGFAQATVDVTDWMAVTLGGRYQSEKRNIRQSDVGTLNTDGSISNLITWNQARDNDNNPYPLSDTTKKFKPKVSLDFRPFDDDTLLYVSWQQAFKSSTYNAVAIYLRPSFVKPEETTAWEIGAKTSLLGGALRLNVAAFQYKIKNLQTQFISLFQGGAVAFENAGRARVRGVDADFTWQLLPSTFDDLVLVGGAAYLDATYTEYEDGTGFDENGFYSTGNDYSGNRVVRTPKFSGSLTLSKTWVAPGGTIELAADAYHNSGFYYAASNFDQSHQDGYDVFGARASYFYEGWGLRLTAFCKNLADEQYTAGTLQTDFGSLTTLAPPRTYGVRVNWDF